MISQTKFTFNLGFRAFSFFLLLNYLKKVDKKQLSVLSFSFCRMKCKIFLFFIYQALRSTESLQGSMETYQEMSSVNATISRIVVQGDSDLNENRHDVLSSQAESHLQKESGNVYGTISTLTTTQGSVHASSATYLTLDSLCQLQSLPNHALLNTAELSNGLIDAGTHFVINTPQIQSINALNQHGNSQVVLVQVPTSQTTNHVSNIF